MTDKLPPETDEQLKPVQESTSSGKSGRPVDTPKNDALPRPEDGDEIRSDGSASAFEGTESIDGVDYNEELRCKEDALKNDPSGRSDY